MLTVLGFILRVSSWGKRLIGRVGHVVFVFPTKHAEECGELGNQLLLLIIRIPKGNRDIGPNFIT